MEEGESGRLSLCEVRAARVAPTTLGVMTDFGRDDILTFGDDVVARGETSDDAMFAMAMGICGWGRIEVGACEEGM